MIYFFLAVSRYFLVVMRLRQLNTAPNEELSTNVCLSLSLPPPPFLHYFSSSCALPVSPISCYFHGVSIFIFSRRTFSSFFSQKTSSSISPQRGREAYWLRTREIVWENERVKGKFGEKTQRTTNENGGCLKGGNGAHNSKANIDESGRAPQPRTSPLCVHSRSTAFHRFKLFLKRSWCVSLFISFFFFSLLLLHLMLISFFFYDWLVDEYYRREMCDFSFSKLWEFNYDFYIHNTFLCIIFTSELFWKLLRAPYLLQISALFSFGLIMFTYRSLFLSSVPFFLFSCLFSRPSQFTFQPPHWPIRSRFRLSTFPFWAAFSASFEILYSICSFFVMGI